MDQFADSSFSVFCAQHRDYGTLRAPILSIVTPTSRRSAASYSHCIAVGSHRRVSAGQVWHSTINFPRIRYRMLPRCQHYNIQTNVLASENVDIWTLWTIAKLYILGLEVQRNSKAVDTPSPPFDNIKSYDYCLEVKRKYYHNCFIYCQRATSLMDTVNKNSSHSPVLPRVCLCVFWVALFIFMFMCVLFYLGQLSNFPSCCGTVITNLNEPPSEFFAG